MRKYSFLLLVFLLFITTGCGSPKPKLNIVMGLGEAEWKVMREVVFPPFEKLHGVKIEAIQINAADLPGVLETQVKSRKVKIDLFAQDNMQLEYLANRGLVADLTDFKKELPETVVPGLVKAGEFDFRLYFLPFRPIVQITYYNADKFKQYGLEPPRNWSELYLVARIFKQKEGAGKIIFKANGGVPTATQLYEWIISAGGNPLTINDEGCINTLAFLQSLWPYLSPDSIHANADTSNEYLAQDSAYLMQNWPSGLRVIVEQYAKEDIATYPGFAGPSQEAHLIGGEMLGIPKGSKKQELALQFVKYLQSRAVQEKLAAQLGWPSLRTDAYETVPAWMKPHFESVNKAMQSGVFCKEVYYWDDYVKYINEAFADIVIRGKPVKETLDYYHNQLELAKQRV